MCRDALEVNEGTLTVKLQDLKAYDADIGHALERDPAQYMPLLEGAVADVMQSLKNKTADGDEPERQEVQVLLTTDQEPLSIRELTAEHVSQLVVVPGIVTSAARTRAKATSLTVQCRDCKNTKRIPCKPGMGGVILPRTCDMAHLEKNCSLDPFVVLPNRSEYVDQQNLKLQEAPEDVPTGEMPRNIMVSVDRKMVQQIVPGTRVQVVGIYSIFQGGNRKGSATIRQPYIRAVGISVSSDGNMRGNTLFTAEEEQSFKDFAAQPDRMDLVFSKVAPSIFGSDDIKRAVACLLFGGSRKFLPDGTRLRGDINVLLLGDPSTAKSQFLKFVEKTAPIAVYTSGKGSSAAGLTASVIRDPQSKEFYLEGGAMVLADGGVVCIDEFDKMRPEDRVAIHEAMEQQTISIAKAGITTVLNSRTAVLAAANPPSGRYDDMATMADNIDLQTTILSRFDLIFIVKDERNYERDLNIARHVLNVHKNAYGSGENKEAEESDQEHAFFKRYVQYCRTRIAPRLSDSASRVLQSEYIKVRQDIRQAGTNSETAGVPITVRQLEAMVRISEALARISLQDVVSDAHVHEAVRLFKSSTLDAARSGIVQDLVMTAEQRNELTSVESQIKRRLAIGAHASERRFVEDLMRIGFSEQMVRRALFFMEQRREIEHKRERRLIKRLA